MLTIKGKILMVILMLMVVTGQTVSAIDASCHMDIAKQSHDQNMDAPCMTSMDHNTKMVHDLENCCSPSNNKTAQSCDKDGKCSSTDFSSAILFPAPLIDRDFALPQKNSKSHFLVTKQFPTTLYRPPIYL